MKRISKEIALAAVMLALLFVAMTLDSVFSSFLSIRFAIASVGSTAAFAFTRKKPMDAFLAGLFFGLSSFITAFLFGKTAFYNPLVSILPRALTGISAFLIYFLTSKFLKLFVKNSTAAEYVALTVGGFATAALNTVFTLSCLFFFAGGDPLAAAFEALFLVGILPEAAVATVICPPLVMGIRVGLGLDPDGPHKKKKTANPEKTGMEESSDASCY